MMNRIGEIIKVITLVAIFLLALIIALPKINFDINGTNINLSSFEQLFVKRDGSAYDLKKGEGLYQTSLTRVDFPAEIEPLTKEITISLIRERLKIANLGDIKLSVNNDEIGDYLNFEFPQYYTSPVEFTKWLTTKGDITFLVGDETAQLLDLEDYDIDGEIKIEFDARYGEHLSFYFKSDKTEILNSTFQGTQSYFGMTIDDIFVFYVLDFDQFIDTNVGRVRVVPVNSLASTDPLASKNLINIVASYLAQTELPINLITSDLVINIEPSRKPSSLTIIAVGTALGLAIFSIGLSLLSKSRTLRSIITNLLVALISITFLVALLKLSGAILSFDLYLSFVFVTLISLVLASQIKDAIKLRAIFVILILLFSGITRLALFNYVFGVIGAIGVLGSFSMFFTLEYLKEINKIDLSGLKLIRKK